MFKYKLNPVTSIGICILNVSHLRDKYLHTNYSGRCLYQYNEDDFSISVLVTNKLFFNCKQKEAVNWQLLSVSMLFMYSNSVKALYKSKFVSRLHVMNMYDCILRWKKLWHLWNWIDGEPQRSTLILWKQGRMHIAQLHNCTIAHCTIAHCTEHTYA